MKREQLRDKTGRIVGQKVSIGGVSLYLNRNGRIVGMYKKDTDITLSTKKGIHGKGDLGLQLVK